MHFLLREDKTYITCMFIIKWTKCFKCSVSCVKLALRHDLKFGAYATEVNVFMVTMHFQRNKSFKHLTDQLEQRLMN